MNPVCATGCNTIVPVTKSSACAPKSYVGEINRVYIGGGAIEPFDNVENIAEWTPRLGDAISTADAIREFRVIGSKGAPTDNTTTGPDGTTIVVSRSHTVNFRVLDASDENYEFMRAMQCGGLITMWYANIGGNMYGGNDGIKVPLNASEQMDEGVNSLERLVFIATWLNQFSPERTISPFGPRAGEIVIPPVTP